MISSINPMLAPRRLVGYPVVYSSSADSVDVDGFSLKVGDSALSSRVRFVLCSVMVAVILRLSSGPDPAAVSKEYSLFSVYSGWNTRHRRRTVSRRGLTRLWVISC